VSEAYRRAGVDLEAAAEAVGLIRDLATGATRPEVLEGVGGFAGLFGLGEGRYLAAATDGVGTKLEVARRAGRLDTVGIDLVAMCADDVVCTGAEPLFFLDYLAVGRVEPERVAEVVGGVAEGCRRAGCALLGGETAEHPDVMAEDAFDLAGFCVGVVDEDATLGPHRVGDGDALIGLASSGLHSNGYSLVRRALLEEGGYALDDVLPRLGRPLVDELLEPPRSTRRSCCRWRARIAPRSRPRDRRRPGREPPRVLPEGLGATVREGSWPVPPIFDLVREVAGASPEEMRATFNMGLGMVLVVQADRAPLALERARALDTSMFEVGVVVPGAGLRFG
jgi:phosphoribosylformylglycinamidine cyclo-ligase